MDVHQLLEYDEWATSTLLEAVGCLSPEQFVHEFAGSLPSPSSIRQQIVHLLSVTDRYRARLAQQAVPDVSPESFATPHDLVAYHAQMRRRLNHFLQRLENENLGEGKRNPVVEHATRSGVFRATVEQTLLHMVNHASYHRGQVASLLKLHDIDFPDTDLILWLNRM